MTIEEILQPLESEITVVEIINLSKKKESNYIVYSEGTPKNIYADGKILYKEKSYEIDLFTDKANRSNFINLLETRLDSLEINYLKISLGYNVDFQRYQTTYSFNLI